MPQNYEPEFKKKIVRLHIEQGWTYKNITEEYGVSKASISKWCSGILRKGNRLEAYRFIQTYHNLFGVRWFLRKFEIAPNAYYNFLKNRKADYCTQKQEVLEEITEIPFNLVRRLNYASKQMFQREPIETILKNFDKGVADK